MTMRFLLFGFSCMNKKSIVITDRQIKTMKCYYIFLIKPLASCVSEFFEVIKITLSKHI